MSALFRWHLAPEVREPEVGDMREVTRFLWWPTEAGGEVRWLGRETISQEAYIGWCADPDFGTVECLKWRNVAWMDEPCYELTDAGRAFLDGAK